jgi:hypothetical protein
LVDPPAEQLATALADVTALPDVAGLDAERLPACLRGSCRRTAIPLRCGIV